MNSTTPTPELAPDEQAAPRGDRGERTSTRTCAGCQAAFARGVEARPADMHVRVVLGPAPAVASAVDAASKTPVPPARAEIAVDFAGTSFGRGAHVHVRPACIERACRGGFARAFKRPIAATPADIAAQIARAAETRIRGLLVGARRARLVAFGEEARDAVATGKAPLAIVAVDAGSSGTKGALLGAVEEGRAIAWGTKAELGQLFGREEVAVVAITHPGVATQIHCARAAADAVSDLARASG